MARGIDTKPYLEWLDGVESIAVSPNTPHGLAAMTFAAVLDRVGHSLGSAITELHVRLDDTPGKCTVLLPDVAFYRPETIRALDPADRLLPNVPPEVIVEVRSPNDRPGFREEKIQRYLAWVAHSFSTSILYLDRSSSTPVTASTRWASMIASAIR